jgi:hypothetical protein
MAKMMKTKGARRSTTLCRGAADAADRLMEVLRDVLPPKLVRGCHDFQCND